jgi:beta-fructofuranosidase
VDPGCFREEDMGFDFYAPQSFVDESGRTIMLGWMGLPDIDYANPSDTEEGWVHCLTVPRELTPSATGDVIRQTPVAELTGLRGRGFAFASGEDTLVEGGRADVVCEGGLAEGGRVTLGTKSCPVALALEVSNGLLSLAFDEACGAGAGRTRRVAPVRSIRDLRILVDRSSVEVFANGGEVVMSTRWYPSDLADGLVVGLVGTGSGAVAWPMADTMASTYATGEAR